MSRHTHRFGVHWTAVLACTFFVAAGLAILPNLGVESDEALFASAIYAPRGEISAIRIGDYRFPLMLMSYLGTLKSYVYRLVFPFGSGIVALRLPMLLAGVGSIWLFYLLLRRISGECAARIGCCLLAADATYLLTTCFDWGPVALQHLLITGGLLLIVKFCQSRSEPSLAGGFFLLGLALWDKALAIWLLGGFAVGAASVLRRQILEAWTWRRAALATAGFVVGALPLVIYNAGNHRATFHGNFRRDTTPLALKAGFLERTAEGGGLFGWLTEEDWRTPQPHAPANVLDRASARISAVAGHPRRHLLLYAFLLAVVLMPLARKGELRAILFAVVALAVAWIQMAITANAGTGVHHTILLWPLPQIAIAVSFAAASRRLGRAGIPAVAVIAAVAVGSGVLVTNEYYAVMRRNGGAQSWNSAILGLSEYAGRTPAKTVYCLDWGMLDALRLLQRGRLSLAMGTDEVAKPEMTPADRERLSNMIADQRNVFVAHTKDFEFFPGLAAKVVDFADRRGYRPTSRTVISDGYGRAVYQVFRFAPTSTTAAR